MFILISRGPQNKTKKRKERIGTAWLYQGTISSSVLFLKGKMCRRGGDGKFR